MRRPVLLTILIVGGALSLRAAGTPAQQPTGVFDIEKVRDNLYVLRGGGGVYAGQKIAAGGNTTVFVTDSGVVVVDTKFAGWGREILNTIRTITPKPVTTIINTHTHLDHTGSNAEFPDTVDIVAHENTKANLSQATCQEVTNCDAFKGANAKFLPKRTFRNTMSLLDGKDRIDLHYFGPGHTNGDAVVVFRALRVAAVGDLFVRKSLPAVFHNDGGSVVALAQTLAKAVAGIKDVDAVITGHSTTVTWRELQEYADFNRDVLAAVQAAMQAGRTAEETAGALKLPAGKYQDYTITAGGTKGHVQRIYDELKKK